MSLSLTKNLLIINTVSLIFLLFNPSAWAAKYEYQINFDARYGNHYYGAPNVATDRQSFEFEQKASFNNEWTASFGARAEVEAAYGSLPERYGIGDVGKKDSQSLFLRDNFLQYQSGVFRARAGYQQVVWGEAFGNYYADIVNPKDYREAGLGDLARNRLDSPLLNLQFIFSESSIQLLYIPLPSHSLLPSSGSDFNGFTLPPPLAHYRLTINRDSDLAPSTGEYGIRFTHQISRLDLSLFYLSYYDRTPIYQLQIDPTSSSATALAYYKPLQTAGLTASLDIGGYLLRAEVLENSNREFNTLVGSNLSSAKSNEFIYVAGVDLPPVDKWQIAFQYSESRLSKNIWLERTDFQSIANARIAKVFRNDISLQALFTDFTEDQSNLLQAQLSFPLGSQIELVFGIDKFDGNDSSTLGQIKKASRVWTMLKTTIKK